jgi:hypothetical protein
MKKLFAFLPVIDEIIRNRADENVADYHDKPFCLIVIDFFWLIMMIVSICCFLTAIISIFWPASYPWYILPGALSSPYLFWRAIHTINCVNHRIVRF